MNRRDFLGRAALAASTLSACARIDLEPRASPRLASSRAPTRVVVVGAGLAGLAAAHELTEAGHDVTILEARARPGGRVDTIREPFSDGLHAEAGALFIPSNHALTLGYVRRFKLTLEPSTPLFEARLFYVRGRRIVANQGVDVEWPFALTPDERKLGRLGMWDRYIGSGLGELGDVTARRWPPDPSDPRLLALDRMTASEFLRSRGASPEAVALLRVGYLDLVGDGIESYSALQMLQHLALREGEIQRFAIRGGADLLPKAFAATLGARLHYRSRVIRIEPGDRSASVVVDQDGQRRRLQADHVVCTIPFSVLRHMDVAPRFSPEKRRAIEELAYTSIARVYLEFRRRVWTRDNLYVTAATDLPAQWVFEHTINQPGPRGILEAQAAGAEGRRVAAMPDRDRIEFALSHLERIFPGIRDDFERATAKCWDQDPWARGAFAYFQPGEMLALLPHIARAEGRVHFAGEHTSPWTGWMQGALDSGVRAAREVQEAG